MLIIDNYDINYDENKSLSIIISKRVYDYLIKLKFETDKQISNDCYIYFQLNNDNYYLNILYNNILNIKEIYLIKSYIKDINDIYNKSKFNRLNKLNNFV
jgi:hypothetical protein